MKARKIDTCDKKWIFAGFLYFAHKIQRVHFITQCILIINFTGYGDNNACKK